ncbi:MAG: GatB/YqeY domain-containing protein, partial [Bacteroidota bacterium]
MSIEALEAQLGEDMKAAMRAKDQVRLEAVRSIRAALTTEKTSAANQGTLTEAQAIAVLQRLKKQRIEAADIFNAQNRTDLAQVEEAQLAVIQTYLPAALEGAELEAAVRELLAANQLTDA